MITVTQVEEYEKEGCQKEAGEKLESRPHLKEGSTLFQAGDLTGAKANYMEGLGRPGPLLLEKPG